MMHIATVPYVPPIGISAASALAAVASSASHRQRRRWRGSLIIETPAQLASTIRLQNIQVRARIDDNVSCFGKRPEGPEHTHPFAHKGQRKSGGAWPVGQMSLVPLHSDYDSLSVGAG